MSTDALFQLGIVSVALNTSQKEELFRRPLRRPLRAPARLAVHMRAHGASAQRALMRPHVGLHRCVPNVVRTHRHPMQDQVSHSRTPA